MQKKIWKILFLIFKIIPIFQNLKIQSIKITKKNKISFLTLSYQNRRFFFNISKFELILNFQISKVNILKSNRSKLQKKKKKYSYSFQKEIAKEKRSENINFNLEPPKWRSFFFFLVISLTLPRCFSGWSVRCQRWQYATSVNGRKKD